MKIPSKQRGCDGKTNLGHSHYQRTADKFALKYGKRYGVYKCPHCGGTHLTTILTKPKGFPKLIYITGE